MEVLVGVGITKPMDSVCRQCNIVFGGGQRCWWNVKVHVLSIVARSNFDRLWWSENSIFVTNSQKIVHSVMDGWWWCWARGAKVSRHVSIRTNEQQQQKKKEDLNRICAKIDIQWRGSTQKKTMHWMWSLINYHVSSIHFHHIYPSQFCCFFFHFSPPFSSAVQLFRS